MDRVRHQAWVSDTFLLVLGTELIENIRKVGPRPADLFRMVRGSVARIPRVRAILPGGCLFYGSLVTLFDYESRIYLLCSGVMGFFPRDLEVVLITL